MNKVKKEKIFLIKKFVFFSSLVYSMMFQNSKNFIGDNTIEGLDELARETVSNDNEPQDDVRILFFKY